MKGEIMCGHNFCLECITTWAKIENSCPTCRTDFKAIRKLDLLNPAVKKRKLNSGAPLVKFIYQEVDKRDEIIKDSPNLISEES